MPFSTVNVVHNNNDHNDIVHDYNHHADHNYHDDDHYNHYHDDHDYSYRDKHKHDCCRCGNCCGTGTGYGGANDHYGAYAQQQVRTSATARRLTLHETCALPGR